ATGALHLGQLLSGEMQPEALPRQRHQLVDVVARMRTSLPAPALDLVVIDGVQLLPTALIAGGNGAPQHLEGEAVALAASPVEELRLLVEARTHLVHAHDRRQIDDRHGRALLRGPQPAYSLRVSTFPGRIHGRTIPRGCPATTFERPCMILRGTFGPS